MRIDVAQNMFQTESVNSDEEVAEEPVQEEDPEPFEE
jgi:hypothetical protein